MGIIISLPISIGLWIWLSKLRGQSFTMKETVRIILCGILSIVVTALVTFLLVGIAAFRVLGTEGIILALTNPQSSELAQIIQNSTSSSSNRSLLSIFLTTLLLVGVVEELSKFFSMKLCIRKKDMAKIQLDLIVITAMVGLVFQVVEDLTYLDDNIISAVMRAITPFHFTFGIIMGYYYSRYRVTKHKIDLLIALAWPILLHTLFDFSIRAVTINEYFIVMVAVMDLLLLFLTVYWIRKISKLNKEEKLNAYVERPITPIAE